MNNALNIAKESYVDVNVFEEKHKSRTTHLKQLPDSCWHSADCLDRQRAIYEKFNVFPHQIIDGIIKKLRSYNDEQLRASIQDNEKEVLKLVRTYLHCG